MKRTKAIIALLLASVLTLMLMGCSNKSNRSAQEYGYYPEPAAAYDAAEFPAVTAQVLVQDAHNGFRLGGREDAYVGLGDGKVGTDANLADRDHGTAESRHPLAAEDFGQVLLDLAGYLKLTGGGCLFHYFTLMIK